ncbi:DNA oxidative demethylase ALKBH2-like [Rutidosis leptorrhynchoides]|uniref:DNA oxidative demethylase ALKBH2-like n=1 Tax=Rutidosis leptorrhynchoides TaxID=125765 RepID=UPI003A990E3D
MQGKLECASPNSCEIVEDVNVKKEIRVLEYGGLDLHVKKKTNTVRDLVKEEQIDFSVQGKLECASPNFSDKKDVNVKKEVRDSVNWDLDLHFKKETSTVRDLVKKKQIGFQMQVKFECANPNSSDDKYVVNLRKEIRDLGNGSDVVYCPRFLAYDKSWEYFNYLNKHIPWTRPTIRVFGKQFLQPRDVCYIASKGLKNLSYSGYTPQAYCWDDFPPLKEILDEVHKAFPEGRFNSLLLNRYNSGNDYVGWHADDEKVYGPKPDIASISFGCERDFFLKKKEKNSKKSQAEDKVEGEPQSKRAKINCEEQYSFNLKHGSLLMMRGNTQRDWLHSVPKRAKATSTRINLTFRLIL